MGRPRVSSRPPRKKQPLGVRPRAVKPLEHPSTLALAAQLRVAVLLADARRAHDEYREHMPRMAMVGGALVAVPGNPPAAREALQRAFDCRAEAEQLDPLGVTAVWATDSWTAIHYALLAYSAERLAE